VGCGPGVGLCYGHGRLNRLRRLGRLMAYHYFYEETGLAFFVIADKAIDTALSFSQTWHYKAGMTQSVAN